jgi:hypothetical protein
LRAADGFRFGCGFLLAQTIGALTILVLLSLVLLSAVLLGANPLALLPR